jgi:hypothetical protein
MHASYSFLFFLAVFFGFASSGVIWKMVSDVNSHLEESEKFDYLGWYPGKLNRLWEKHSRFYPRSLLRLCFVIFFLTAALCMAFAAARRF